VPLLTQSGPFDRDALYWHYPHYHPGGATPCATIRRGDWKLTRYFEDGRLELFDLKADPSEKTDLARTEPDRAADWPAAGPLAEGRERPDADAEPEPRPGGEAVKGRRVNRAFVAWVFNPCLLDFCGAKKHGLKTHATKARHRSPCRCGCTCRSLP
jgi:hypothetical protein